MGLLWTRLGRIRATNHCFLDSEGCVYDFLLLFVRGDWERWEFVARIQDGGVLEEKRVERRPLAARRLLPMAPDTVSHTIASHISHSSPLPPSSQQFKQGLHGGKSIPSF